MTHPTNAQLEAGLDDIRHSPRDEGRLERIVRRPNHGEREDVAQAELDLTLGLVGDNWKARGNPRRPGGLANPDCQLNVMNARVAALVAVTADRWALAGDQLYVDFDLSVANVPPGTRLAIGSAVIEVTAEPHTGCGKFLTRFGVDAAKFVNSRVGRELQLRGINAKVVQSGTIRVHDAVRKISSAQA
jgi:MOSC domain-containing protein YiiM